MAVCYRMDNPAGTQFLPSPCEYRSLPMILVDIGHWSKESDCIVTIRLESVDDSIFGGLDVEVWAKIIKSMDWACD